jgi:predicted esterase
MRRRAVLLGALSGASAIAVAVIVCRSRPEVSKERADDVGLEAWCAAGLEPIAGGGCFAGPRLARDAGAGTPLVVYVHGRYSPRTLDDELTRQGRVARLATAKGFGVLAMRGRQGECEQAELADTWCWPSNPRNAEHGAAFVKGFDPAIAAARRRLGAGPNLLLGFSNGAYFATLIATRALGAFDAIAIAHGGPVQPTRAVGAKPPLLLLTADDDPSDGEMRELDLELSHERWPHEMVSREGGHALPDVDVSFALSFFDRALREPLPLRPPLQAPRPRPRDAAVENERDASAAGAERSDAAAAAPEDEDEDGGA